MLTATSKQSMLTGMIEKHIRRDAEPMARADADALKAVILAELEKIGVNHQYTSLHSFIDDVEACRLGALIEARTTAVADRMVADSQPVSVARKSEYIAAAVASGVSSGLDAKSPEFLGATDTVPAAVTPQVASLAMAHGDALVLTTPHQLSREQLAAMKQRIRSDLDADVRILIIDGGVSLAVLTGLPAAGDGVTGD
ncbi:hypothetical protein [Janthinobacterium aquaticum]|uniref:hypothetical protein n=1 Tax=Janthinobacterium sp. FT58W TaxID=2654254 RepID=UPI00126520A9|nr:hypothetical protein [Janthinobacterium sp. FT58W]KAB8042564.1 hypothetical protein GCM43_13655 [Janthinobacterium sp. FT58W]